ncbi:PREDICTED: putative disease resistance protein At1g50180 [Erythranthe guttata]|uniref:putative disease resistance protein At1g50180 n=1 Tax=Erythranthe guttata TaxID=4155 RepID=UPI00064E05A1|nr:PREDICTED: putative disease resistance protein At1g50180 [Erythranthe guttata]|eukprot:XP_012844197.1 PREDICTED: putative disease resistance protein At1g50180 [Erythranthe guttata]
MAIQLSLETLRDLLIEEGRFLYGVSDEVKKVERDLKTIHCILMDADKWRDRHKAAILGDWIDELDELASRAEYVLERYAIEVTSRRGGNLMKKLKRFGCIFGECLTSHEVGEEIEAIRSSLTILTGRLQTIVPGGRSSNPTDDHQHYSRLAFEHDSEQHFVGMEKDIASLVSLVKNKQIPMIAIYGMGGLGKTTLARKIYHHKKVVPCFEARAWVCSTQQFQPKIVLSQILKQLLLDEENERINDMELAEVVVKLHNFLMQKRCLIVIDDIWETGHWNILEPAFPKAGDKCKVILTTRNREVSPRKFCLYELRFLAEDEGWELLQKLAFTTTRGQFLPSDLEHYLFSVLVFHHAEPLETEQSLEDGSFHSAKLEIDESLPEVYHNAEPETEQSPLEAIGKQMVQKCGGLPLAITVLGGILCEKQTSGEWKRVSEDVDLYLKRGDEKVKQVLDLSYDALPYYLKPCFLYLGCFPEDQEIDTERLYLLWMAEGLISSEEKGRKETLRDVAERYLNELASRCMVQVRKHEYCSSAYNAFKSCRLHDLIRDLCLSKGKEKGFLKLIDETNYAPIHVASRLAIHCDGTAHVDNNYFNKGEETNLRSFLFLCKGWRRRLLVIGSKGSAIDFNKLKRLRILALENGEFILSNEVGNLIHLRYLSLYKSCVEELPLSVFNLPYLQTLDLRTTMQIKVPNVICKMKRLKHLLLKGIQVVGEYGDQLILDGLEELETLQDESHPSCVRFADIPRLTNLVNLKIEVGSNVDLSIIAQRMSCRNTQLRESHLSISNCDFNPKRGSNYTNLRKMLMSPSLATLKLNNSTCISLPRYQQWMCANLIDFSLYEGGTIEGDSLMRILGKFPLLKRLSLSQLKFTKAEIRCLATSFPQLKFLNLHCLSNLERWVVDKGAMPNLSRLQISLCERLEMIPHGLRYITSLQELNSVFMPKEFNDRLRVVNDEPREDYRKVCHVPSITLYDDSRVKVGSIKQNKYHTKFPVRGPHSFYTGWDNDDSNSEQHEPRRSEQHEPRRSEQHEPRRIERRVSQPVAESATM